MKKLTLSLLIMCSVLLTGCTITAQMPFRACNTDKDCGDKEFCDHDLYEEVRGFALCKYKPVLPPADEDTVETSDNADSSEEPDLADESPEETEAEAEAEEEQAPIIPMGIRASLTWDEQEPCRRGMQAGETCTKTDFDLFVAKYRSNGTVGVVCPHVHYGRNMNEAVACETDADCAGQSCVPLSNIAEDTGKFICYNYNEEQIDDSVFARNPETTWGRLDIDATEGNQDPEIIAIEHPEPGQTYRVIIRFYMKILVTMTENSWETENLSDETFANLRITVDGKQCVMMTNGMRQLANEDGSRPEKTPFYKMFDINYQNGDCTEVKPIYGLEYNDTYLFDPLDPVNPRSMWCDVESSPGCP